MHNLKSEISANLALISGCFSVAFKMGVAVGGACLLFYCYRISYFPVGLSLGDAILLILLAASFGIIYGFFIACLTALGLWWTPFLRPMHRLMVIGLRKIGRKKIPDPPDLARPGFLAFILGWFGIFLIYTINKAHPGAVWNLIGTSFFLGLSVAAYKTVATKLSESNKLERTFLEISDFVRNENSSRIDSLKVARLSIVIFIFLWPLFWAGASGFLLDSSMRFSGIRKKPAYTLIKSPYSSLVPKALRSSNGPQLGDYQAFESVEILFSGIGTKIVISYSKDKEKEFIAIPSESVITVQR